MSRNHTYPTMYHPAYQFRSLAALCLAMLLTQSMTRAEEQAAGRQAWFVASSIPDDLDNPILVRTGKDITEVTLTTRAASAPVPIPQDGLIEVVREIEDPENPGETAYHTLARVTIPENVRQAMVILIPVKQESEFGLRFQTKAQNLANFRGGSFMFLNLTNLNVAVQLGEERIPLRPGATSITKAPDTKVPVNKPISYHYFHPEREEWQRISGSTVALVPSRREICVFTWDTRYNRINYRGISFPVSGK